MSPATTKSTSKGVEVVGEGLVPSQNPSPIEILKAGTVALGAEPPDPRQNPRIPVLAVGEGLALFPP